MATTPRTGTVKATALPGITGTVRAAALATGTGSRLCELRCSCPAAVAEARIVERARRGGDASEVTVELARELAARAAPWPDAVEVDTTQPLGAATRAAAAAVRNLP